MRVIHNASKKRGRRAISIPNHLTNRAKLSCDRLRNHSTQFSLPPEHVFVHQHFSVTSRNLTRSLRIEQVNFKAKHIRGTTRQNHTVVNSFSESTPRYVADLGGARRTMFSFRFFPTFHFPCIDRSKSSASVVIH